MRSKNIKKLLLCVLAGIFTTSAFADNADLETRVKQLEELLKTMQQQRAEQDKQLEILTKELVGVENQLTQTKNAKIEEKGKSKGAPLFVNNKNGLSIEDGSGDWNLQLNGRVQADYRTYSPDDWKNDTWTIRRARLGGTYNFLKDFSVRVEGEYANESIGAKATTALTYGYLDFNRWKSAKIRVGQFKPFFGLERAYSTNFTDFTELSLATNNGAIFTSTYDRGLMIHGDPLPWLNYNIYAVNGSGQNNDDVRDGKDIGARVNANFAELMGVKNSVIHLGASVSDGSVGFSTSTGNSLTQVSEANGVTFFTVANLLNTARSDRTRAGVETAIAVGPWKFQSEYIHANFEGNRTGTGKFDNDINAWYANLNWMLTGEQYADSYKSGVFGRMKPKNNLDDKEGWGAWELGLRYSHYDASDFKSLLTTATSSTSFTSQASSWTGGVKWIMNPNARVLLNYIQTDYENQILVNSKRDDKEKAIVMRAQYDF
jgi:phosphate-selective porin OprO/OprP